MALSWLENGGRDIPPSQPSHPQSLRLVSCLHHHSSPSHHSAVAAFGTKGLSFQSPPALNSRWLLCAHYHYHANQGLWASMVSLGLATTYIPTSPLPGTHGPLALGEHRPAVPWDQAGDRGQSPGNSRPRALPV